MSDISPDQIAALKTAVASTPGLVALLDGPSASTVLTCLGKKLLGDSHADISDIIKAASSASPLDLLSAQQEAARQQNSAGGQDSVSVAQSNGDKAATGAVTEIAAAADAMRTQITGHDRTNRYLAYGVTAMFFVLIISLIALGAWRANDDLNPDIKSLLFTMFGVVATGWTTIIGFYFGSSSGSAQKSQTLAASLNTALAKPTDNSATKS
jgi:hypothetical protein